MSVFLPIPRARLPGTAGTGTPCGLRGSGRARGGDEGWVLAQRSPLEFSGRPCPVPVSAVWAQDVPSGCGREDVPVSQQGLQGTCRELAGGSCPRSRASVPEPLLLRWPGRVP